MLDFIIYITLSVAFFILLITKLGIRERLMNYADEIGLHLLAEMLSCDFCLSFWLSVMIGVSMLMLIGDYKILLYAILSVPLTRYLL